MIGGGYEQAILNRHREMHIAIDRALRRAAGLGDDARLIDDAGFSVASIIITTSYGKAPVAKKPKATAKNLKDIRRKSRYLRAQIAAIDGWTQGMINRAGSIHWNEYEAASDEGDFDRLIAAFRSAENEPHDHWTIPAALAALEQLENALATVIKKADENALSGALPATGRPPDMAKMGVALIVGKFLRDATGEVPRLWSDNAPPEPWKRGKPSEPFAVALRKIFQILGFKPGIEAAGEFATSKLS